VLNFNRIRLFSFPFIRLILIGLAIALASGFSFLLFATEYAPLFIVGIVLSFIILSICIKQPSVALCISLFVILLPDGLLPATVQSYLNRSLTIITFGVFLLNYFQYKRRIVISSSAFFMIVFLLWSMVTLFWTQSIDTSLHYLQRYLLRFLLFLFLFPNLIRSMKELKFLIGTLAFSGWILALVSILLILTTGYAGGSRLKVLEENENSLGIGLLISLIGVLYLALDKQSRYQNIYKIFSYIYLVIVIFITGLSGSRGSAISLVMTIIMFIFWKSTRQWGILGLLIIGFGLIAAPIAFSTTLDRFAIIAGDTLLGGREALWQAAWRTIQLHLWNGVGIGNAPIAIIPFVRLLRSIGGSESVAIHNPVLAIWAETGLPGLFLYLCVVGSAVWIFLKIFLLNRRKKSVSRIVFTSCWVCFYWIYVFMDKRWRNGI
jgi:O-antigen ligase